MAKVTGTLTKTPIAEKSYWFVKPDCGTYATVTSFNKITNNSDMIFLSCTVNATQLTDCDGNVYAAGKVLIATLSDGDDKKQETCEVVYTTSNGETDSFRFDVKISAE